MLTIYVYKMYTQNHIENAIIRRKFIIFILMLYVQRFVVLDKPSSCHYKLNMLRVKTYERQPYMQIIYSYIMINEFDLQYTYCVK